MAGKAGGELFETALVGQGNQGPADGNEVGHVAPYG